VGHAGHAVDQLTAARHHVDLLAQQLAADVGGLRAGQRLDPVVDLRQRDLGVLDAPPMPSESTTVTSVTSLPRPAATSAAS
jgi:hypothetical protein